MAALARPPLLRTPSPKIRIRGSRSFDSPSSRISVTPIDDSPYSKSANSILAKPLPQIDVLKAGEHAMMNRTKVMLHNKMSEDSIMSSDSEDTDISSSVESSPTSENGLQFGLFGSGSSSLSLAPSSSPHPQPVSRFANTPEAMPAPRSIRGSDSFEVYQDPETPMHDPWLVRVVLDMHDVRGFDWMVIADVIERVWRYKTSSVEVLGILSGNGRVKRQWWD